MKNILSSSLLLFTMALGACTPKLNSGASIGNFVHGLVDGSDASVTEGVVQKVRLRTENNERILEYLDPKVAKVAEGSTEAPKENWIKMGRMTSFPTGTQFYHWGPDRDVKYWAKNGISNDDIDSAVRRFDPNDRMGGGFYVSLNPVDTVSYGEKVIVAEPKHDVIALDLSSTLNEFDPYKKAVAYYVSGYFQRDKPAFIPVALIAEAGVEAIKYNENWLVTIRASLLENLFEGSWANFFKNSKDKSFNYIGQFAIRYPITDEVWNNPDFRQSEPKLSKFLNKEAMTDQETQELVSEFTTKLMNAGLLSSGKVRQGLFSSDVWKPLLEKVEGQYRASLIARLKSQMQGYTTGSSMSYFLSTLSQYNLTIQDLDPEYVTLLQPNINGNSQPGTQLRTNTQLRMLLAHIPVFGPYKQIAEIMKGNPTPWFRKDDPSVMMGRKVLQVANTLYKPVDMVLKIASILADEEVSFRDMPQTVGGDVYLDGPDQPGYLAISGVQKRELEQSKLVTPTFKEKVLPDGKKSYFVRYECPSAQNYQRSSVYLTLGLQQKLQAAEQAGTLKDPSSGESRALTKAMVTELVDTIGASELKYQLPNMARICMFQDSPLSFRTMTSFVYARTRDTLNIINPEWLTVASSLEWQEMIRKNDSIEYGFYRTLSMGASVTDKINFTEDIGIWEVLSNQGGPHKDPGAFVKAVKSRFKSAEVQQWVEAGHDARVFRALHEAGKDL